MKSKIHNLRLKYKTEQDILRNKAIKNPGDVLRMHEVSGAIEALNSLLK